MFHYFIYCYLPCHSCREQKVACISLLSPTLYSQQPCEAGQAKRLWLAHGHPISFVKKWGLEPSSPKILAPAENIIYKPICLRLLSWPNGASLFRGSISFTHQWCGTKSKFLVCLWGKQKMLFLGVHRVVSISVSLKDWGQWSPRVILAWDLYPLSILCCFKHPLLFL